MAAQSFVPVTKVICILGAPPARFYSIYSGFFYSCFYSCRLVRARIGIALGSHHHGRRVTSTPRPTSHHGRRVRHTRYCAGLPIAARSVAVCGCLHSGGLGFSDSLPQLLSLTESHLQVLITDTKMKSGQLETRFTPPRCSSAGRQSGFEVRCRAPSGAEEIGQKESFLHCTDT